MKSIRIQNLRCLEDTEQVELKPLTILVGKNSSGKSTFLRFFPLMKQTMETRTNEPILWYSSRFVDFGSFEESVNLKNNDTICFEFGFELPMGILNSESIFQKRRKGFYWYGYRYYDSNPNDIFKFNLRVETSKKKLERFLIFFEDHQIEVDFKQKDGRPKIRINGETSVEHEIATSHDNGTFSSILPTFFMKDGKDIEQVFEDKLYKLFKKIAYFSTSRVTITRLINNVRIGSYDKVVESIKKQDTTAHKLIENIASMRQGDPSLNELVNNIIGMNINIIITVCNKYLENYFSSVKYIAPLRASAERYYRVQGLSLDEIDPQGENIPMILHNMSSTESEEFSNWVYNNFGFEITTKSEGGHISLKLRYKNSSEEINLADTGFGFSQILPIIILLWQAEHNQMHSDVFDYERCFVITIEQPELHLHPALQAKLIDTFSQIVKRATENDFKLQIIMETHSETMINRIGYLVAKGVFNHDLVSVIIFNQESAYVSKLEKTEYSKKGYLLDWPIGFFSAEDL